MQVRVSDVNYGGHLGNVEVLGMVHEARVRFLDSLGFSELDIGGVGILVTDATLSYKSEAFLGENIVIRVGVGNLTKCGSDFYFKLEKQKNGKEVAIAKTTVVFYDYAKGKVVSLPRIFLDKVDRFK